MILDTTAKSIDFISAEAVTTNPLDFSTVFRDHPGAVTKPQGSDGASIGAVLVAAPGVSTIREIEEICIYNADTVQHKVTVRLKNGVNMRSLVQATLAVAATLYYNRVEGWVKLAL